MALQFNGPSDDGDISLNNDTQLHSIDQRLCQRVRGLRPVAWELNQGSLDCRRGGVAHLSKQPDQCVCGVGVGYASLCQLNNVPRSFVRLAAASDTFKIKCSVWVCSPIWTLFFLFFRFSLHDNHRLRRFNIMVCYFGTRSASCNF